MSVTVQSQVRTPGQAVASDTHLHLCLIWQQLYYFRQNQHRMNYLEMREQEWPSGSGMVESGAKQFKARFCGPGMRWRRTGADNLLPIGCLLGSAILSHRFDELWATLYPAPLS